jgi:hypothetical protein
MRRMLELLALLSVPLAGLAIVVAWRARAASHRLALEMVRLRDRLSEAEAARAAAEERAAHLPQGRDLDPELVTRIDRLEARERAARSREATVVGPVGGCEDLRVMVEERLRLQGFERVTFLPGSEDGAAPEGAPPGAGGLIVEAERGGVTAKGRAEVRPDGTVRLRSVSSVRAFP